MTNENPLIHIDFGSISKPATVLIEKVSDAVGGIFKPTQIVRVAKAEAEAKKIAAIAGMEISEIQQRGLQRFIKEEEKKQLNMESITKRAIPLLGEKAKPENIEQDWLTNFFDKCRLISDDEMQLLWARILAGEANAAGQFSKRTINLLGSMDKQDATLFTKLCGFNWMIIDYVPLIFDINLEIYSKNGINFSILKHLDSIGLLSYDYIGGYQKTRLPKQVPVIYQNNMFLLELPLENNNNLLVGNVMLTSVGQQLANICSPDPVDGFIEFTVERWRNNNVKVTPVK